jgi:hypothetical protein
MARAKCVPKNPAPPKITAVLLVTPLNGLYRTQRALLTDGSVKVGISVHILAIPLHDLA